MTKCLSLENMHERHRTLTPTIAASYKEAATVIPIRLLQATSMHTYAY